MPLILKLTAALRMFLHVPFVFQALKCTFEFLPLSLPFRSLPLHLSLTYTFTL